MSDQKNTPTPTIDDTPEDTGRAKKGFTDPFDDPLAGGIIEKEPEVIADRYKVLSKLGQGGMGRVYKALDNLLAREVAVKLLNRELGDDQFVRRFQLEAKAASQLKHPNILQVLDFGMTKSGEPYMTMEFVVGQTLDDVISINGPLPVDDAIDITIEICKGMQHAHRHRIVHRDLKPSNIMLIANDPERKACVLDFGIAKLETDDQGMLTLTGQIIGSPRCISPEQARGEPLDGRSDIYSLGCVLYEILSGKPPFTGGSAMDTISKHLSEPAPVLSKDRYPPALSDIVDKMLRKNPDDRFLSMADIIVALERIDSQPEIVPIRLSAPKEEASTPINKPLNVRYVIGAFLAIALIAVSFFVVVMPKLQESTLPPPALPEHDARVLGTTSKEDNRDVTEVGDTFVKSTLKQTKESSRTGEGLADNELALANKLSTKKELADLLSKHPGSVLLRFNRGTLTREMVALIKKQKSIARMRFDHTIIAPDVMKAISEIDSIERMKFNGVSIEAKSLASLRKMPKLNSLQFDHFAIKDEHLAQIGQIERLEYLGIEHAGPFSLKGYQCLTNLTKLEYLDLNYLKLTDDALKIVAEIPRLKRLCLKGNDYIHPEALAYFQGRDMFLNVSDCRFIVAEQLPYLAKHLKIKIIQDRPFSLENMRKMTF